MNVYALFKAMILSSIFSVGPLPKYLPPPEIGVQILRVAEAEHYNPFDLAGQVYAETRYKKGMANGVGCEGLMQVKQNIKERFHTSSSLFAGTKYMKTLIKKEGSLHGALVAYNEGPTAYAVGIRYPVAEKYSWLAGYVAKFLRKDAVRRSKSYVFQPVNLVPVLIKGETPHATLALD